MSINMYEKNNRKLYEARIRLQDSCGNWVEKRKRNFKSEKQARKWEYAVYKGLGSGTIQLGTMIWSDWHEHFLENLKLSMKNSTIINYDGALKKWLPTTWKNTKMKNFSKADVHYFLFETLGDRVTEHMRKNLRRRISRVFQAAVEEGVIARNPSLGIKVTAPISEKKVLSADEVSLLLKKAKEVEHLFYPAWVMALFTGMRSGELYALEWKDIDLESGLISVHRQWTSKDGLHNTKTNKCRVVPISDALKQFLEAYRLERKPYREVLKPTRPPYHEYISEDLVLPRLQQWKDGEQAKVLRSFCSQIGITLVGFHDLRATFITNLLSQGVPLPKVMAIVGHSRMSTTDVYLRLAGINLHKATDKLGYELSF